MPVVVLAISMLVLPATLRAQREPAAPTTDRAAADTTPDTTPPKVAAPRSLMGMVMATLIESAEQRQASTQASTQQAQSAASGATGEPVQAAAAVTEPADEAAPAEQQVAVQTVP